MPQKGDYGTYADSFSARVVRGIVLGAVEGPNYALVYVDDEITGRKLFVRI